MSIPVSHWFIWLPLLAMPLVYLLGRLVPAWRVSRWAALVALLATGALFAVSWQAFARQGTVSFALGQVKMRVDGISLLLAALVLVLATLVTLSSGPAIAGAAGEEKYYALLLGMSGAMMGLGCAADLFNLWLWFEAMAVTSYLLVAFYREEPASLEAGVKYLAQSVLGSTLVLLGVALALAQTGTLDLTAMPGAVAGAGKTLLLLTAGGLFVVGFGVKIALVPLHTWLPDAHAQAPSGISAMLSGVVIEAGLVALLRTQVAFAGVAVSWGLLLMGMGALNMLAGNLLALRQTQVKRLLAYSSIGHVGYMLLGVGTAVYAGEAAGAQGGLFHLINHGLMKGLAFLAAGALLYGLRTAVDDHRPLMIPELSGAAQRYPLVAVALAVALLGLGGIPPLAGFMSKLQIMAAGMATGQAPIIGLVAFAAFNSLLSLAYYLPLALVVFRPEASLAVQSGRPLPIALHLPLFLLAGAIVLVGLWPDLVYGLTEAAGAALFTAAGGP